MGPSRRPGAPGAPWGGAAGPRASWGTTEQPRRHKKGPDRPRLGAPTALFRGHRRSRSIGLESWRKQLFLDRWASAYIWARDHTSHFDQGRLLHLKNSARNAVDRFSPAAGPNPPFRVSAHTTLNCLTCSSCFYSGSMAVADAAIEKTNEPHLGHSTSTRGDELLLEAILPALAAPQTSHRSEDFSLLPLDGRSEHYSLYATSS